MTTWPTARARALRRALLQWYEPRRHTYPWRRTRDSYQIWVSEVMLQQTRIAVVQPAYERFVARFPDVASLAAADEETVLSLWSGLGYYQRARALHRAARILCERGESRLPRDLEAARALPGIGAYTAAAVLSIAFDLPHAAVDGNVVRVLSRLACLPAPDSRQQPHRRLAEHLLSPDRPGDWNQAIMELGQTVCRPHAPDCGVCPLARSCQARKRGRVHEFPERTVRRPLERHEIDLVLAHHDANRFVLERGVFPHLRHLWLPLASAAGNFSPHANARGTFTHTIVRRRFQVRLLEWPLAHEGLDQLVALAPLGTRAIFQRTDIDRIGRSALLTKSLRMIGLDG